MVTVSFTEVLWERQSRILSDTQTVTTPRPSVTSI